MITDPNQKFFVVFTISPSIDYFVVVGILSRREDAEAMAEHYRNAPEHCAVGHVKELSMPDILTLLVRDRLADIAKVLEPIIASTAAEK